MNEDVNNLLEAVNGFLIPLRLGDGYNEDKFQHMCRSIRSFHRIYANADMLPKVSVSIFVDLSPSIEGCISLYKGDEQQKILDAAVTVVDVISEGL